MVEETRLMAKIYASRNRSGTGPFPFACSRRPRSERWSELGGFSVNTPTTLLLQRVRTPMTEKPPTRAENASKEEAGSQAEFRSGQRVYRREAKSDRCLHC